MDTLLIDLVNNTGSPLWAHVTGIGAEGIFAIESDGATVYRPNSPNAPLQELEKDIAISVSGRGVTPINVPYAEGARIFFSKDKQLKFLLNPGPAWVESSVTDVADPNIDIEWGFCEFTFNKEQVFINISYVDFVGLPIALQMKKSSDPPEDAVVKGIPRNGVEMVCKQLEAKGGPWEKLVVKSGDKYLRALSPNSGLAIDPRIFGTYYDRYVNSVWGIYDGEDLTVNTQVWGDLTGRVKDGLLTFSEDVSFGKPATSDIFSCDTGPFSPEGANERKLNVGARLCAAFNRSTLHENAEQPEGERVENFYDSSITNHYARICHETNWDNRGYAFPYDDVASTESGDNDQSGFLEDAKPKYLRVTVGGIE